MRRSLLAALLFFLAIQGGQAQNRAPGEPWTCSVDNQNDAYAACISPANLGMRRYVTDIIAQSTAATSDVFNIAYDTTAGCLGVPTELFPPGSGAARYAAAPNAQAPSTFRLAKPLVAPAGTSVCVRGGATNTVTFQLMGYSAP